MLISCISFRFHKFLKVNAVNQMSAKCTFVQSCCTYAQKSKLSPCMPLTYGGSRSDVLPIPNLSVRRGDGSAHVPVSLPPETEPPLRTEQDAVRVWTLYRRQEALAPARVICNPARSLVIMLITISRRIK
jgi:hypothetical protein